MEEPLRLEFVCNPAELKQAQELQLTDQVGGGSKWRTIAVLAVWLGILGVLGFAKLLAMDPAFRPYAMGSVAVVIACMVVLTYWLRKRQPGEPEELKCLVEVTSREIRVAGPNGWAIVPWSGFGKALESDVLFVIPDATGYQLLVFPKRVFPDEASCNWFREQALRERQAVVLAAAEPVSSNVDSTTRGDIVRLEVMLRLSDYLDRALASWKIRGIMCFVTALFLGSYVAAMLNQPPDAVLSDAEVFFYFVLPFLVVLEVVLFLTIAVWTWMQHRHVLRPQVIELGDHGISFSQSDARGSAHWSGGACFKETPWSFLVWWKASDVWFQLPKRAFATKDDVARCREILATKASNSAWYWG